MPRAAAIAPRVIERTVAKQLAQHKTDRRAPMRPDPQNEASSIEAVVIAYFWMVNLDR
jgi:hypothetical protein